MEAFEDGFTFVGPQEDGTYGIPDVAQTTLPSDAGGGLPGNYGQQVLDVFKYGIGSWMQYQGQKNMLDYRRFEATAVGPQQQGVPAGAVTTTVSAGGSGLMMLAIVGALVFLVARRG